MYLWRAVDAEGEVLDVLVQAKCDTKAAGKLMRKLLKDQGMAPDEWVTDKNPAYGAALRRLELTKVPHTRRKRANNRAESSHVPVRRRERKLQGFKSPRSAQRFLSLHAATYNLFTISPPLFQPALIASFVLRRSRHGAMRPASAPDTRWRTTPHASIRQFDNAFIATRELRAQRRAERGLAPGESARG